MSAPKTRVPAYAMAASGAAIGSVSSRVAWARRTGGISPERLVEWLERAQSSATDGRAEVLEILSDLNVNFDSPEFDLDAIADAARQLTRLHHNLRDVGAYQILLEESEFNRGVVRLPTPSAMREDMDKLSPSNRRRALGMIEQLLQKQQHGHNDAEEA